VGRRAYIEEGNVEIGCVCIKGIVMYRVGELVFDISYKIWVIKKESDFGLDIY